MHILFTVNAAWNIVNFRRPLVEALRSDGHRITVLAPPDDSVRELEALGCTFEPLEMDVQGLSPRRDLGLVLRLRRHFRRLAPDAVLSFTIKNNIYGALAARGTGVRFIPNVTGLGTAFLSTGLLQRTAEALYRTAFRPLDLVFFQNADDRDLFLARGLVRAEQAHLLPGSGIDLERFAPAPLPAGPEVRFLMIARLLRDKGVLEYVEAARALGAEGAPARFQLLGPLGAQNRTAISQEMVEAWQREGCIDYLGESSDVRHEIAAADCVVLPSYREGAPRTLIEAAAMARPLVATDVPGCRAVVDPGHNGLLCEVRDAASLAQACRDLIAAGPDRRAEMGRNGREKMAREFDQRLVIEAYRRALATPAERAG
ncbi:glycosyltransferase family 1 protein [Rhodosalinus halophilus]|uniref:Glycosyltransferase family 1 protein n=1 Tax=Rhodosalinus halophilus TaxID=2259333 RepID=A0A365U4V7_9RHOB|nr:glycosyltransferase family 4 protein [Rhodosalinus halophilus]RBI83317.1 glycosyltransferase family 1 protein [Rhodosalinus halophilus]